MLMQGRPISFIRFHTNLSPGSPACPLRIPVPFIGSRLHRVPRSTQYYLSGFGYHKCHRFFSGQALILLHHATAGQNGTLAYKAWHLGTWTAAVMR